MPHTMTDTGKVARPGSEASMVPTMPAVAAITVLLPPASACATARTNAFRLATRSSATKGEISAITDMMSPGGEITNGAPVLAGAPRDDHGRRCRSEVQRARVPHFDVPRLGGRMRADLAERGLQLVGHQVDDVTRPVGAERAEAPEERLAGQRRVGAERQ